jgi:molybdenum cofactor biosynthesis enzyme MoaA
MSASSAISAAGTAISAPVLSRPEMMDAETLDQVLAYAAKNPFETIDITGGAPELHMHIREMIEGFAPLA